MYRRNNLSGFSVIELLIALVLLSMASALVLPNLFAWLDASERKTLIQSVELELASLPLRARAKKQSFVVSSAKDLSLDGVELQFDPPLRVLSNGVCLDSTVSVSLIDENTPNQTLKTFSVVAPFCELELSR